MIRVGLFLTAFTLCAGYAFKAGGKPERVAMMAQLIALLLSSSVAFWRDSGVFATLIRGWLMIDLTLLLVLILVALRANRIWTIVLAGLQLAAIFAHLSKTLYPGLSPLGYAVFVQIWAWPMLIATALGVRNHRRRVAILGKEADWRPLTFSGPA